LHVHEKHESGKRLAELLSWEKQPRKGVGGTQTYLQKKLTGAAYNLQSKNAEKMEGVRDIQFDTAYD